jgi:hypothetical protein
MATPTKTGEETTPSDITLYLEIDNGIANDPGAGRQAGIENKTTAVYVPDRKQLGNTIDVILYFHGHKDGKTQDIKHVCNDDRNPMRTVLSQSTKKHFVFVAPQLGAKAEGGNLDTDVKPMLDQVMLGLEAYLSLGSTPTVGNIVLAAHSGGGERLRVVAAQTWVDSKLLEVWCFDCLYTGWKEPTAARSDASYWIKWKGSHAKQRLAIFFLPGGSEALNTATNSRPIKKAFDDGKIQNVLALELTAGVKNPPAGFKTGYVDHPKIPATFLQALLDSCMSLR